MSVKPIFKIEPQQLVGYNALARNDVGNIKGMQNDISDLAPNDQKL